MELVGTWTGRTACLLQEAMRMTNEVFAEHLGISTRTITRWHSSPEMTHRIEVQQILDTAYEQAGEAVQRRFAILTRPESHSIAAQALRVAIAVVVRGAEVLLVCRRGDASLRWQFPAGMVKPGGLSADVAVQETVAETGVHAAVRRHLGERLHPVTGVIADYHLCEYLAGEAVNSDLVENSAVAWVAINDLSKFIPADKIYPPIMAALEDA
ncbi:NUDIX domain-containing protein [Streptomyces sp. NPDC051597]|uniref:NUDIX domain-containing protein n=1 Tax=Streptomyces sp. NPDC051597 TaxID=3155049 RepID=UPI003436176D